MFLGNNLYNKGLLCGASAYDAGSVSEDYVPRKKDMLKANISLYVEARTGRAPSRCGCQGQTGTMQRRRSTSYWKENRFSLRITPLNGGEIGMWNRADRTSTASGAHNAYPPADRHGGSDDLRLNMEDFGFGEFFRDAPVLGEDDFDQAAGYCGRQRHCSQASAGADTTDTATVASEQSAAGADAKSAAPPVLAES